MNFWNVNCRCDCNLYVGGGRVWGGCWAETDGDGSPASWLTERELHPRRPASKSCPAHSCVALGGPLWASSSLPGEQRVASGLFWKVFLSEPQVALSLPLFPRAFLLTSEQDRLRGNVLFVQLQPHWTFSFSLFKNWRWNLCCWTLISIPHTIEPSFS